MSFSNILDAVNHNSMFTHRYVGVCQCCGDIYEPEKLKSFRPVNTKLFIENDVGGDVLYCDKCEKYLNIYNNLFQFYNLAATDIKCSHQGLKIPRSDGSVSDVSIENAIAVFNKSKKQVLIKFKFLNKGDYAFKAVPIDKFIKTNNDIFQRDDFKLSIMLKKVDSEKIINGKTEELTENYRKLYNNYEEIYDIKLLEEFKQGFGEKLEIIYA